MKKILVVVDMQNDFVRGSLANNEAVKIIPNIIKKINTYPLENRFATRDTHFENYMETMEGKKLPVLHCIKNTKGWEIIDEIKSFINTENIIDKTIFGAIDLVNILKKYDKKENIEIELVGVCTDICVISNAILLKTYFPEREIIVDSKCCAGVTADKHKAALEIMKSCQIEVI